MCGIAGVISKKSIDREQFEKMTDIISHRGPDDRGIWCDDNICLGHRRLSIIDLSEAGHQPFIFDDRYVLVFNGEIYNYIELKEELTDQGVAFHTQCDTEVLAAAYSVWGDKCVEHFNGMWAFAIYDIQKRTIFCSRDRYGVKPFYYHLEDGELIFGSEIKQILLMRDTDVYPNLSKVYEYMVTGKIDRSEETLFDEVLQLMPGHNLTYDLSDHSYRIEEYYDVYKIISGRYDKLGYKKASRKFIRCFEDSVKLRLRSDVRLGFCLSGGLDSSANVCVAKKIQDDITQETVTHCSEYDDYNEWGYAEEVIKKVGVKSYKTKSEAEDLISDIDRFLWYNDEPFGSSSIYASWSVFKKAGECGLKVMIDGQGADELLAGYTDWYPVYFTYLIENSKYLTFAYEVFMYYAKRKKSGDYWSKKDMVLKPIKVGRKRREGLISNDEQSVGNSDHSPFLSEQLAAAYNNNVVGVYADMEEYKRENFRTILALLHCEDRMTMAHSIESRLPYLDYRMVELLGGLPMSHRIRHGMTKAVMREAIKGIVPDNVRKRILKLGFATPEERWINDNLDLFDKEVRGSVDYLADKGILDRDKALKWWNETKDDIKRGNRFPWRIICTAHWMKVFDIKPVASRYIKRSE